MNLRGDVDSGWERRCEREGEWWGGGWGVGGGGRHKSCVSWMDLSITPRYNFKMLHYKLSAVLLLTLTHVSLGLTKHWPYL